jgi:hypothetical protein
MRQWFGLCYGQQGGRAMHCKWSLVKMHTHHALPISFIGSQQPVQKHRRYMQCFWNLLIVDEVFCCVLARVPGYRSRGPGLNSWCYQIF